MTRQDIVEFPYRSGIGESMVYGPLVIAAILTLGAVSQGLPFLFLSIPIGLGFALFHLPMVQQGKVPLAAESRGVAVGGLGLIPWSSIRAIAYRERQLRTMRLGEIVISMVNEPEKAMVQREKVPMWRQWQTKIWRFDDHDLIIDLRSIDGDPNAVYQAIEDFRRR